MSWIEVLREKQTELRLIASWASQTGHNKVRDLCRQAEHDLAVELERHLGDSNKVSEGSR